MKDWRKAPAYIIHLPSATERESCLHTLRKIGFNAEWELGSKTTKEILNNWDVVSPRTVFNIKYGRLEHESIDSLGAIGCYMTHVKLWAKIVEGKIPWMFIFEDDAHIHNPQKLVDTLDHLFGSSEFIWLGTIPRFKEMCFGCHAYCLSYKGATKLLKHALPISMHIDAYISFMIDEKKINAIKLNLVDQKGRSTLGHGAAPVSGFAPYSSSLIMNPKVILIGLIALTVLIIGLSAFAMYQRNN